MNDNHQETKDTIRAELEATRKAFHTVFTSYSESDFRRKSRNPGWTNGEILAHMTFGFIILNALLPMARLWGYLPRWTSKIFASTLNALTTPFNWINALGARLQARILTHQRIGRVYDWVHFSLIKQLDEIKDDEWERGMHYPSRWDPNFHDFMTIRELFHYPIRHFSFHLEQLSQ
jgi:DinB superfamily